MSEFTILQHSDHTVQEAGSEKKQSVVPRWVPSRYNVQATTSQGSLVLWNIYSNKMSVFKPDLVPLVKEVLCKVGVNERKAGITKFLVDRGFLVDRTVNEFRRFRYAFGKEHYTKDRLQLFLLASEDCNFRCRYCYESFARGTMEPSVRTAVKRYLEKQLPTLRRFRLEWFGGEPLYGMEAIADIAPFALELSLKNHVDYASKITTNAYLLTPEVIERLFAWHILNYQITLDGPPEHHNRSRPARDGGPTFDTILANLKAMRRRDEDFHVMLRVNFDRDNEPALDQLLDILKQELGADQRFRLTFRAIRRWGGMRDDELNICTDEEARSIYWRMEAEARKRGLLLTGTIHNAGGLGAQVCYAARPNSFVIGATGKVMKCTIQLDSDDSNIVGKINDLGDLVLDENKMSIWTEPAFEDDVKCKKCVFVPSCYGMSCPLIRLQTKNSPCISEKTTFKRSLRIAAGDFPDQVGSCER